MGKKSLVLVVLLLAISGCSTGSNGGYTPGEVTPDDSIDSTTTTTPTETQKSYPVGYARDPDDPGETVRNFWLNDSKYNDTFNSTKIEHYIYLRVNEIRENRGINTLEYSDRLASVARAHSKDMVEKRYLSHDNKQGQTPYERWSDIAPRGCANSAIDENLVFLTLSENDLKRFAKTENPNKAFAHWVVKLWMTSEPHREAMLDKYHENEYVGVGVYSEEVKNYADTDMNYVLVGAGMMMCGGVDPGEVKTQPFNEGDTEYNQSDAVPPWWTPTNSTANETSTENGNK